MGIVETHAVDIIPYILLQEGEPKTFTFGKGVIINSFNEQCWSLSSNIVVSRTKSNYSASNLVELRTASMEPRLSTLTQAATISPSPSTSG